VELEVAEALLSEIAQVRMDAAAVDRASRVKVFHTMQSCKLGRAGDFRPRIRKTGLTAQKRHGCGSSLRSPSHSG
jgi:hypothetical protein